MGGLGANMAVSVAGPPVKTPAWHATDLNGQEMGRILSRRERTGRNGQETGRILSGREGTGQELWEKDRVER